jgi:hypothetical protein
MLRGDVARCRRVDSPAGTLLRRLLTESESADLAGHGLGIPVGRRGQDPGAGDGAEGGAGLEAEAYAVEGLAVGADGTVRLASRRVAVGDTVGSRAEAGRDRPHGPYRGHGGSPIGVCSVTVLCHGLLVCSCCRLLVSAAKIPDSLPRCSIRVVTPRDCSTIAFCRTLQYGLLPNPRRPNRRALHFTPPQPTKP